MRLTAGVDPLVAAAATAVLPAGGSVITASDAVAGDLGRAGWRTHAADLRALADGRADVLALLGDELSHARDGAEGLVAEAARVLRPGGLLAVSALASVWAAATGDAAHGARRFTADALAGALGHFGFAVEARYAPGAAARLAGAAARFDADLDRAPGLLDAAERVVAVARRHRDAAERSRTFFGALPRKVVAASVLCRDRAGRLLVVHDSFRGHWTIPGGVVDADECPRDGAAREAWEESGTRVRTGALLGVFAASWPDRLVFVFDAAPDREPPAEPVPVHAHEIDGAAWVTLDEALDRLAAPVAEQVRRSLEAPGGVWRQ